MSYIPLSSNLLENIDFKIKNYNNSLFPVIHNEEASEHSDLTLLY